MDPEPNTEDVGLTREEKAVAKRLANARLLRDYAISATLDVPDQIITDLSDAPLEQMEAIITQLKAMRMSIGAETPAEEKTAQFIQKKALIAGNKLDLAGASDNYRQLQEMYGEQFPTIAISARQGTGLEELKTQVFETLEIIRVYTKTPGQKPDLSDPIILGRGSTLEDAAEEVHKDFKAKLRYARLWGSGKHDGIMVKRDHILQDGDIIELHA